MAEAILLSKHWGNNLGVRLPAAVAREAHLHADQRVRVTVESGRAVIEPIRGWTLTLEQRLACLTRRFMAARAWRWTRSGAEKYMVIRKADWVPERQEIIWIDCNPQAGLRNARPPSFLVLSPRVFNERTSLVIGLPMTTAAQCQQSVCHSGRHYRWRQIQQNQLCVLCHQPKSFDWRVRDATPHPMRKLADARFARSLRCP